MSEYTNERVIGHHVAASRDEKSDLGKQVDRLLKQNDMGRMLDDRFITIEEGDVDWDDTRKVRITLTELEQIAEKFL